MACLPKPPCPPPPAPEVIIVEPTPKIYPVEELEPLEEVVIYPLNTPGIIGGVTEQDVKAMQRNIVRTMKWGIVNKNTLEIINYDATVKKREEQ